MFPCCSKWARRAHRTAALAAVLPDVRVESLRGQAHEGMTTAPRMYADAVARFLLETEASAPRS